MHKPACDRDHRPVSAVDGDCAAAVTVGVGGGDRFAVGAEHRDFGQPRRFELVEAQRGAVDDGFPVEQADRDGVGDAGFQSQRLWFRASGVQSADLWAVAEVDGHHGRVCRY